MEALPHHSQSPQEAHAPTPVPVTSTPRRFHPLERTAVSRSWPTVPARLRVRYRLSVVGR